MSNGRQQLHRIHEALGAFERAVVAREHKGITQSAVVLQQDVDRARDALVKTVVDMVTEAKLSPKA